MQSWFTVTLFPQVWWRALLLVILWRVLEKGRGVLYSVGPRSQDLVLTLVTGQVQSTVTNDRCYPYPQEIITLLLMTSTTVYQGCCPSRFLAFPLWGLTSVALLVSDQNLYVVSWLVQQCSVWCDVVVCISASSKCIIVWWIFPVNYSYNIITMLCSLASVSETKCPLALIQTESVTVLLEYFVNTVSLGTVVLESSPYTLHVYW